MFQQEICVRFSECDSVGRMTFQSVVGSFQDVAHSHDLNCGFNVLERRVFGYYWILLSWDIEVDRYPKMDEHLTVTTYVKFQPRFFCTRGFEMADESGTIIARATSNWCMCDTEKNQMASIPQIVFDNVEEDEHVVMPKLSLINELEKQTFHPLRIFPVELRHIDVNCHVNNVSYIRFALDELDPANVIRKARIYYSSPGKVGESLTISSCDLEGTHVLRTAATDTDETKTVMQFWIDENK